MPFPPSAQSRPGSRPPSAAERVAGLSGRLQAFLVGTLRDGGITADQARERMPDVDFAAGMSGLTAAEIPMRRTLPEGQELRYHFPAAVAEAVAGLSAHLDPEAYPRIGTAAADRDAQAWTRWETAHADDQTASAFLLRTGVRLARIGHLDRLLSALAGRSVRGVRLIRAVDALRGRAPHAALAHLGVPEPEGEEPALDLALESALRVQCGQIIGTDVDHRWVEVLRGHPRTGVPETDSYLALQTGVAELYAGRPVQAESMMLQAVALAEMGTEATLKLMAATVLSTVAGYSGDNELMTIRAATALAFAADHELLADAMAVQAAATVAMGRILTGQYPDADALELGVLRNATATDWDDLDGVRRTGPHTTVIYQLVRARAAGRPTSAQAVELARSLEQLIRIDQAGTALRLLPSVIAMLLAARRTLTATDLVQQADRHYGDLPEVAVSSVMISLAEERIDEATVRLRGIDAPETGMIRLTRVRLWMLRAVLAHRAGEAAQVWPAMARALELAEYESLIMPFLDHAADVAAILAAVPAESEQSRDFIDRILESIVVDNRGVSPRLTPAEQVVLEHLADGLSRREAAESLGVSINTVRTHVRHIYRKFGAGSRAEALATARGRGLID